MESFSTKQRNYPSTAVAIATYMRDEVLINTIKKVLDQDPLPDEILIIDQTPAHEPNTEAYLTQKNKAGSIKWFKQEQPNLPMARNRALVLTKCEVLIFLDDDIELIDKDFIFRHARHYINNSVWAVCGQVLKIDRKTINITIEKAYELGVWFPGNADLPLLTGLPMLRGGNHSIRVERAKQIGGYDENLHYGEDSDMGLRLSPNGKHIIIDTSCRIVHLAIQNGGCHYHRNNRHTPEWHKTMPIWVTIFRHPKGAGIISLSNFHLLFRAGPLRKENVIYPGRWIGAWVNFIYGMYKGWQIAKSEVRYLIPSKISD